MQLATGCPVASKIIAFSIPQALEGHIGACAGLHLGVLLLLDGLLLSILHLHGTPLQPELLLLPMPFHVLVLLSHLGVLLDGPAEALAHLAWEWICLKCLAHMVL